MRYYEKHIFFCLNQRANEKKCCFTNDTESLFSFAKQYLKQIDHDKKLKIRINKAGCLGRCQEGPVIVIYPDGIWYRYENEDDIKEIIEKTVLNNMLVERLLLSNENKKSAEE